MCKLTTNRKEGRKYNSNVGRGHGEAFSELRKNSLAKVKGDEVIPIREMRRMQYLTASELALQKL